MGERLSTSWQDHLPRRVREEPKKAIAVAVLLTLMAVAWARSLMGASQPRTASAGMTLPSAAPRVEQAPRLSGGPLSRQALSDWLRKPVVPVRRNLFVIRAATQPAQPAAATRAEKEDEGFWDKLAKSLADQADQERARQVAIDKARADASRLKLQSTVMTSGSPKALVNERLICEGDTVGGFRVVKIEARRIVVERESVKLEVRFEGNQ